MAKITPDLAKSDKPFQTLFNRMFLPTTEKTPLDERYNSIPQKKHIRSVRKAIIRVI